MAFWNNPSSLLPKQSHRWVVYLGAETDLESLYARDDIDTIPHYFAQSVERPSYKIETVKAKYLYAHTFNFPKRLEWNPIKIEFKDILITEIGNQNEFKNFVRNPKIAKNTTKITSQVDPPVKYELAQRTAHVSTYQTPRSVIGEGGSVEGSEEATVSGNQINFQGATVTAGNRPQTPEFRGTTTDFYDKVTQTQRYQKSTQVFFYQFLQKCGYFDPNELDLPDQLLRFRSYHFKKNMVGALTAKRVDLLNNNSDQYDKDYLIIAELSGEGTITEYWKVYNPIISSITNGKLDYSTDGILSITVDLVYDWAELVPMAGRTMEKRSAAVGYKPPVVEQEDIDSEEEEIARKEQDVGGEADRQELARLKANSDAYEAQRKPRASMAYELEPNIDRNTTITTIQQGRQVYNDTVSTPPKTKIFYTKEEE